MRKGRSSLLFRNPAPPCVRSSVFADVGLASCCDCELCHMEWREDVTVATAPTAPTRRRRRRSKCLTYGDVYGHIHYCHSVVGAAGLQPRRVGG